MKYNAMEILIWAVSHNVSPICGYNLYVSQMVKFISERCVGTLRRCPHLKTYDIDGDFY